MKAHVDIFYSPVFSRQLIMVMKQAHVLVLTTYTLVKHLRSESPASLPTQDVPHTHQRDSCFAFPILINFTKCTNSIIFPSQNIQLKRS